MKNTDSTNIDFSLTTKYIFMGITIAAILLMVVLIITESTNFSDNSMKRITSYVMVMITGIIMLFVVSRLFDPQRKEKEREELFASIRQAMKEQREIRN
jgi:ABC-type nickel/cobalt efflux system permease component RcnA